MTLQNCIDSILELDRSGSSGLQLRHQVFAALEILSANILAAEELGEAEHVRSLLNPLWTLFGQSPFLNRIQNWPRGYPGDFETIEYLMAGLNTCNSHSTPFFVEEYFLRSATAQQHAHKLRFQRNAFVRTITEKPRGYRILSIASGSSLDLRECLFELEHVDGQIVLNDQDAMALEMASKTLGKHAEKITFQIGNALRFVARHRKEEHQYDLVVAGGLFDYLSDSTIEHLLRILYLDLLRAEGRIVFTNMAKGNPLRPLMEYTANWHLIERNDDDYKRLVNNAVGSHASIQIERDVTGLSLLMTLQKS